MTDYKKYIIGTLLILVSLSIIYISFNNTVRMRVDTDKTTFYIKLLNDDGEPYGRWLVSGREYNSLMDGSSKMNRDVSNIVVNISINEINNQTTITRITPYKRGPVIIDTYKFNGNTKDVELFPVSHKIQIINGSDYFYRYEVKDLTYSGETKKLSGETELEFGMRMKLELQEGYRWGWVYSYGGVRVQYDIPTNDCIFEIRLFDPNWDIAAGSALEFETNNDLYNSLVKINDTHYLNTYEGVDADGFAIVLTVDGTTVTNGTAFEFDEILGRYNSLVKIDDTHYLNTHEGSSYDGYVVVLMVDGTTVTKEGSFEFDEIKGKYNSLVQINSTHYLNTYSGVDTDGFAIVLTVEAPPTEITTWAELAAINDNLGGDYILANTLSSSDTGYDTYASSTANSGAGWLPIGPNSSNEFSGSFNGQNYTISDLYIDRTTSYLGLFGIADNAEIKNVGIVDCNITGVEYVGGLIGVIESGTVTNCYSTGSISGTQSVGGLVGSIGGTVTNCYSDVTVNIGIVLTNSFGGLSGVLVSDGIINQSYATGNINSLGPTVGGLVGNTAGLITNSYAIGNVTGTDSIGGLVGFVAAIATTTNSYATGSVNGTDKIGGLIGEAAFTTVTNSYSTGIVTGNTNVGGLFGSDLFSLSTITTSYWDINTSGQATSNGGTGKTTIEMQDINTFNSTWNIIGVASSDIRNISYIWNIVDDSTYPFLSWKDLDAPTDTCTYSSGNWAVTCSDNCTIATNTTLDAGGNITFTGTGYFEVSENIFISNFDYLYAPATCYLYTHASGGFQQ